MKNLKKTIAMMLALVMVLGVLVGCNNEKPVETQGNPGKQTEPSKQTEPISEPTEPVEELEPVVLKWYLYNGEMEGSADVEEAFNAKLAEVLPNTTVDFVFVESYGKNWPMFMSGGEKIDIAWGGYATPFLQDAMDGNLLGLSELVEKYGPNLKAEWDIWYEDYNSAVLEGELYGIPCIQPLTKEAQRFNVGEQFIKYMDIDAFNAELRKDRKMTQTKLDMIEAAIEAAIADGTFVVGSTEWNCMYNLNFAALGYMPVGSSSYNLWFDPEAEEPVVMHLWELPEAKMLLERYAEWADRGWYTDTVILGQHPASSEWIFRMVTGWNTNCADFDEDGLLYIAQTQGNDTPAYYQWISNLPSEGYVGLTTFGGSSSYNVIPYTSENPERAMMLLNLLHDEPGTVGNDLFNMISYGFEQNSEEAAKYGWFNYATIPDGEYFSMDASVRNGAPTKHELYAWMMGNTYKSYSVVGDVLTTATAKEYAKNYWANVYSNLKKTPLAGYSLLFGECADYQANVKTVFAEYENQLNFGGGGTATAMDLYETVMQKMNEAGLGEIKAILQAQIDEIVGK